MPLKFIIFLLGSLTLFACNKGQKRDQSRVPYCEVEGHYLYLDQIQSVIPDGTSKADSLSIANDYVQKWVTQVLLLDKAESNITNQEEIDELVEEYRNSLIIHQYQQNLVKERLQDAYTDEQLVAFYNNNKDKFTLTTPIIKGVYMKMPLGAPKLSNAEAWMKNFNSKSLQNLEKYSLQNATSYEYFGDKWVYFNEVASNLPAVAANFQSGLSKNKYIELSDSTYHYMLRVLDFMPPGSVEPYEMAKDKIKSLLLNTQKIDFIKSFENKLYQEAVKDKDITYFKNEE